MIGRFRDLLRLSGGEWMLSFTTREDPRELIDRLKDAEIRMDLKKYNPVRSLDANAFCWAMCSDIGRALRPPVEKEEVYRQAIRAVGMYTDVTVCVWDVEKVLDRWTKRGVGWFVDVLDDDGPGKKRLCLYYGTSTYTVDEFRIVLDWLVDQCEQMGIPLRMSKEEEERVLAQWQKVSCKKTAPAISAAG